MNKEEYNEIVKRINTLIDEQVQPAVEQHGGFIKFEDFDQSTGRVSVLLQGSCSGCASSTITLKMGVENMLKHYTVSYTHLTLPTILRV